MRNPNFDPDARDRVILRAIANGAQTVRDVLPHTSLNSVANVRKFCAVLLRKGFLQSRMAFAAGSHNPLSRWSHGPKARHYRITDSGRERLAELERKFAPPAPAEKLA